MSHLEWFRNRNNVPRSVKTSTKIIVTAIAAYYLYTVIPFKDVLRVFNSLPTVFIIILSLLALLSIGLLSLTLKYLVSTKSAISFLQSLRIHCIGAVANTFLPSRAGMLITTPYLISKWTSLTKTEGVAIQGIKFAAVSLWTGLLAVIGIAVTYSSLSPPLLILLSASCTLYIGFIFVAITGSRLSSQLIQVAPPTVKQFAEKHSVAFPRRRIAVAFGIILVYFVVFIIRFWLLSNAFGQAYPLIYYIFLPSMAYVVTVLPVSFGGIGIAEATGVTVLVALGTPESIAAAIILTDRVFGAYLPLAAMFLFTTVDSWAQPAIGS